MQDLCDGTSLSHNAINVMKRVSPTIYKNTLIRYSNIYLYINICINYSSHPSTHITLYLAYIQARKPLSFVIVYTYYLEIVTIFPLNRGKVTVKSHGYL